MTAKNRLSFQEFYRIKMNDLVSSTTTLDALIDTSFRGWDYETFVSTALIVKEHEDISRFLLGKLAEGITKEFGDSTLDKFAHEIKVDVKTLYEYQIVYKKYGDKLFSPERKLPYKSYRYAAHTDQPEEWIEKAESNDWSANQLAREIKMDSPHCTHPIEVTVKVCGECGMRLN